jgi:hypothetical protein
MLALTSFLACNFMFYSALPINIKNKHFITYYKTRQLITESASFIEFNLHILSKKFNYVTKNNLIIP